MMNPLSSTKTVFNVLGLYMAWQYLHCNMHICQKIECKLYDSSDHFILFHFSFGCESVCLMICKTTNHEVQIEYKIYVLKKTLVLPLLITSLSASISMEQK